MLRYSSSEIVGFSAASAMFSSSVGVALCLDPLGWELSSLLQDIRHSGVIYECPLELGVTVFGLEVSSWSLDGLNKQTTGPINDLLSVLFWAIRHEEANHTDESLYGSG